MTLRGNADFSSSKTCRKSGLKNFLLLRRPTVNHQSKSCSNVLSNDKRESNNTGVTLCTSESVQDMKSTISNDTFCYSSYNSISEINGRHSSFSRRQGAMSNSNFEHSDWPPRNPETVPVVMGFAAAAYEAKRFDHYMRSQSSLRSNDVEMSDSYDDDL